MLKILVLNERESGGLWRASVQERKRPWHVLACFGMFWHVWIFYLSNSPVIESDRSTSPFDTIVIQNLPSSRFCKIHLNVILSPPRFSIAVQGSVVSVIEPWDLTLRKKYVSVLSLGTSFSEQLRLSLGFVFQWAGITQVLGRGRDFSLCHHIWTDSGDHSVSYPMDFGGSFPRCKVIVAWTWLIISI
jgi:hypothetical protein